MKKKICVITGSRAEYGLLKWVMKGIYEDSSSTLQILVTGSHLSDTHGLTYKTIENEGFDIDEKVEILSDSDSPIDIAKSMGHGFIGFADALNKLCPDLIVVLGDRYEIFSAVSTALVMNIPVAHLHGGEVTEGAIDESLRHSITKMSHLHFVATDEYRQRVIQLGEDPNNVFKVGGLGIDNIKKIDLLDKKSLEAELEFSLGDKNLLITFHPVTLEKGLAEIHAKELLKSLKKLKNTNLIFTMPNADADGNKIMQLIEDFVSKHNNAAVYKSLGQLLYLSCLAYMDGVVGNSSSGLTEAPSFKIGTINIGNRQKGRIQATSVINCEAESRSISNAINTLYSTTFQENLKLVKNPYGEGGASAKIVSKICSIFIEGLIKKRFYDLRVDNE
ncbi:UDP-N-acetylglucosamine 2-epimerase [Gammaproteobacteria bacterium]|nr:UDP-N-acetylglucosamine 2-epimerase [Gammaproteobacteria bacterium]